MTRRQWVELLVLMLLPAGAGIATYAAVSAINHPLPCDCTYEIQTGKGTLAEKQMVISAIERRCTDAIGRQVAELRSCQMRCPEPEAESK